jgi:hypothetical protein
LSIEDGNLGGEYAHQIGNPHPQILFFLHPFLPFFVFLRVLRAFVVRI